MNVRSATDADAPALGRMGVALARMHHQLDPRRFFLLRDMEDGYASWLAKEAASPRAVVLVAVSGTERRERILGYTYGRLEGRDWNTLRDPAGVGVDIFVTPRARRRGVGRMLVDALVAELARRGAPQIVIQVAARNDTATAAFEALGFRRTMIELARDCEPVTAKRTGRPRSRTTSSRARPRPG
ncbi:MAG TPA: GNAT family N-acetyltransferase [Anaeromyxobacteraceae bacterium]|nr:GNAT family N-acetyltransferase [Anaeromyxobacteraceae bacterium]